LAEPGVEQKLAAILAADVASYTRLMADDEHATIATITDYRERFQAHIEGNGGRVVDMAGDSVLAVFNSAAGALAAAVATQKELAGRNAELPESRRMQFRVGINTGDIQEADDGRVYGEGVNIAARLEGLAEPGGIMLSESAHLQVRRAPGLAFADAGRHEVKNVDELVRAFRVLADGATAPVKPRRHKLVAIAGVAVVVVAGIAGLLWSQLAPTQPPAPGKGPAIAVLPFANLSGDPTQAFFADGITEELTAALSRFQALSVTARTSTLQYKETTADAREIGQALSVNYLLEGSVRRDVDTVRITAQLIDTGDGAHLWSETYERDLSAAGIFEVQDEIGQNVAAALAGVYGILLERETAEARRKPPESITSYDCVLLARVFWEHRTLAELPSLMDCLENAVAAEPDYADAWIIISDLYVSDFELSLGIRPDPVALALEAAEHAVTLEPRRHDAHKAKAVAHYFAHDIVSFLAETEIALSLNPNDPETLAHLGLLLGNVGQRERAAKMIHRAMRLQPAYPTWWYFGLVWDHYDHGRYEAALADALKIDLEDHFWTHVGRTIAYARLGRLPEASAAAARIAETYPGVFSIEAARAEMVKFNNDEALIADVLDALRLAGVPETPPAPARPVIVVLPFDNMGADLAQEYFADGITEDITTRLSRFSDLAVIARNSAFQYKGEAVDVEAVAEELGATYVVEGSVRRSEDRVRVTAQLLEAGAATHMWADTWDRDLTAGDVFDIQDEITSGIVGVIAGVHGVIARSAATEARQRPDSLDSYDCVLQAYAYHRQPGADAFGAAQSCLNDVLLREPDYVDGLSAFTMIATEGYSVGWGMPDDDRATLLADALDAGQRAIALAPEDSKSHWSLAYAEFVSGDIAGFHAHTERAMALNPNDADVMGAAGVLLSFSGEYDRGLELIEEGMSRNPHHPGWWHLGSVCAYWSTGRNAEALTAILKVNQPENFWLHIWRGILAGEVGDSESAAAALASLESVYPGFTIARYRDEITYWQVTPEFMERAVAALRKAGVPEGPPPAVRPVIAVLPFDNMSGDPEQEYFADGITEDIITRLARFPDIGVIARNSSFQYKGEAVDVRAVAEELGATYVLEGSVRRSENDIRVIAQLLDATDGTHLWAETYDRDLSAGSVFEIQDDITARVVGAIASSDSVIAMAVVDASDAKAPAELASYECVLRTGEYWRVAIPDVHLQVRGCLEHVVSTEPDYAQAFAFLSHVTIDEFLYGYNPQPEMAPPLDRALDHAQRAVDLDPTSAMAHYALARTAFYQHSMGTFRAEIDRSVELAPNNTFILAGAGHFLAYSGGWERGMSLMAKAKSLNPHHQTWYHFPYFYDAYRQGLDDEALAAAQRINMPGFFWTHVVLGAAYGQLGSNDEAGSSIETLRRLYPGYSIRTLKDHLRMWNFEETIIERMADGLRKAGVPENTN
jgi:TolB-like protein/class 3 adenylate cyclase/Tfp pilus assembly protein PilF